MDAGLTTIDEKDIAKHLATAQSLVTRMVMMEAAESQSNTEIAGTGRRFVSTVSTGGLRKSREVEFIKTIQKIRPDDPMLSIGQHALLYRARRRHSCGAGGGGHLCAADAAGSAGGAQCGEGAGGRGCVAVPRLSVGVGLCLGIHVCGLYRADDRGGVGGGQ